MKTVIEICTSKTPSNDMRDEYYNSAAGKIERKRLHTTYTLYNIMEEEGDSGGNVTSTGERETTTSDSLSHYEDLNLQDLLKTEETIHLLESDMQALILTLKRKPASEEFPTAPIDNDYIERKDSGYMSIKSIYKKKNLLSGQLSPNSISQITLLPQPLTTTSSAEISTQTSSIFVNDEIEDTYITTPLSRILNELLQTEKKYILDLQTLLLSFQKLTSLTPNQTLLLTRNATHLFYFQERFLHRLENILIHSSPHATQEEEEDIVMSVAALFIELRKKWFVYETYCTRHDGAMKVLVDIEATKEGGKVMKAFRKEQERLDVRDFLIKPVQRICRYPLFLAEMEKYLLGGGNKVKELVGEAKREMENVARRIDDAKVYIDMLLRTDLFFKRCGTEGMDYGGVLYGGVLLTFTDTFMKPVYLGVFVFKECIVLVKTKKERYTVIKVLRFSEYGFCDQQDGTEKHESFSFWREKQEWMFECTTTWERKGWCAQIRKRYMKLGLEVDRGETAFKRTLSLGDVHGDISSPVLQKDLNTTPKGQKTKDMKPFHSPSTCSSLPSFTKLSFYSSAKANSFTSSKYTYWKRDSVKRESVFGHVRDVCYFGMHDDVDDVIIPDAYHNALDPEKEVKVRENMSIQTHCIVKKKSYASILKSQMTIKQEQREKEGNLKKLVHHLMKRRFSGTSITEDS